MRAETIGCARPSPSSKDTNRRLPPKTVTATPFARNALDYTDFLPLDITLYFQNGTIFLPREY
jgi:hypothetical protein